jgi:RinA family phage transcriptional activator
MSRYKFALSAKIKGMVEWQLEHYHEDKRQLEQYKTDLIPSPVQKYSKTAGCSHGISRSTEDISERIITNAYVLQTERSCQAIESVMQRLDDIDRQIVDLVYWKQSYTAEGAGMKLNLSRTATYNHINNILCTIALEMGYVSI